jgi:tetratricopeptide (TPR) repeat protein
MTIEASLPAAGETKQSFAADMAWVFGIALLAFIVRYQYLVQIQPIPLFSNLIADSHAYDQWAIAIAAGDWLGKEIFYQAPLYPYLLGAFYTLFGRDLWMVRLAQIALGAVSCGLLYLAGRQFFSRPTGIAAGVIVSLYAPSIFYEVLIQKSVVDLFLIAALLVVLGDSLERPDALRWLLAGFIVGLLALARENALLWLPVLALWLCWYFASYRFSKRLIWVAWLCLGTSMALVPVGLRNLRVGGEFVLTTAQMGPNFFIGNNPKATGIYEPLRPGRADPEFERVDARELAEKALGKSLSPTQVSGYWLEQGWNYIRSQPGDWILLLGKKWLLTWNTLEVADSDDYYVYQEWSPLLRALSALGNFTFLAPLAAVGWLLTLEERRRRAILYALILAMAASVAVFYIFGRYRFPLVPLLALFAGAGIARVYEMIKTRRFLWLSGATLAAVVTVIVVRIPVKGPPGPTVSGYYHLARAFARIGKTDEAIGAYQKALQLDPRDAVLHYNLGSLLGMQGNVEQSRLHLEQAVKFNPNYAEAHSNLGNVYLLLGKVKDASASYRKALEIDPGFDDTRFNLGMALLRDGEFKAAAEQFQLIVDKNPANAEAQFFLGNALAAEKKLDKAVERFREVIRLKPDFDNAYVALARALAMTGRTEEAMQVYQKALAILKAKKQTEKSAAATARGGAR